MNRIKFPYGVSNIEKLVTQGYHFVDKTQYIEKLEQESKESYVSFLRPRRFGKSLWLSILEYYYDINQKHKFETIFGKYYIGQNPTPLRNSYRILKFDFSGINTETKETTQQGFNFKVKTYIERFIFYYSCFSEEAKKSILISDDGEEIINRFFEYYPKDIPIYILFDEYDHFTNDILYRNKNEFIDSVSKQGYVRKFYEVIKSATQSGVVDKLFITGVSSITLDALTSGFNILTHLSHHQEFEAMLGFEENEVLALIRLVVQDKSRENEVLAEMKEWYNGYRFSEESTQSIYNSNMVLYYLDHYSQTQKAPRQLLDINIAPDYGKLKQMFQVVNMQENKQVLQTVLENGNILAPLIAQFNFERGFGMNELVNFLAYMGNLTIDKAELGGVVFKIPNKVIEELYWKYYADRLQNWAEIDDESYYIYQAVLTMAKNADYQPFFELVQKVLKNLSNRDFIQFNEKQVKMVIIAYLMVANIFDVISEREVQSGGYPDLLLFQRNNSPYDHHQFVIELKYLKKEEKDKLQEMQEQAKTQLLSYYQQDKVLQNKKMLHLLTIVAIKDELYVEKINV